MAQGIDSFVRTHQCSTLSKTNIGETVTLMGWVQKRRDFGGLIFLDLRDRSGLVQVVFNPEINYDSFKSADSLRSEYVVAIKGQVEARPKENVNPEILTGEIEVNGLELKILDTAKTPPFLINN